MSYSILKLDRQGTGFLEKVLEAADKYRRSISLDSEKVDEHRVLTNHCNFIRAYVERLKDQCTTLRYVGENSNNPYLVEIQHWEYTPRDLCPYCTMVLPYSPGMGTREAVDFLRKYGFLDKNRNHVIVIEDENDSD